LSAPQQYNITIIPNQTGVIGDGVPIPVTINASAPGATKNLITSVTAGNLRDDYPGNGPVQWFGMWITVGPNPLTVSSVGRYYAGNATQNHPVVIIDANSGIQVPNGRATVNAASAGRNQFAYAPLPDGGAVLAARRQYYVLSLETQDSDQFCDSNTIVGYQADATVSGSVFSATNLASFSSGGPAGSTFGPLDLKYAIGGTPMLLGSPFSQINQGDQHMYQSGVGNFFYFPSGIRIVSGTITLDGAFYWAPPTYPVPPPGTMVVQWVVDDNTPNANAPGSHTILSPYITGPIDSTNTNNFPWQFDTTQLADGTHSFYVRFVDSTSGITNGNPYQFASNSGVLIVQNHGQTNGVQPIPLTQAGQQPARLLSPSSDWIHYPGSWQAQTPVPYPTVFVPPCTSNQSLYFKNPAQMRGAQWIDNLTGMHFHEYDTLTYLSTTPNNGGVLICHSNAQVAGGTAESQYAATLCFQGYAGGRGDMTISSYSSWVAAPDGTGFYGIELPGRLVKLDYQGTLTHLAGDTRDRTKLPSEAALATALPEEQKLARMIFVGTIAPLPGQSSPSFADFRGLNDLCFDPRDRTNNTIYVASPRRHIIIKVDLATNPPTLTRYAGRDGVCNGVDGWFNKGAPCGSEEGASINAPIQNGRALETSPGAGPVALFNEPYSIIMADGRNPNIPAGTMFVADFCNGAIRYISADGNTVGTLVGVQPAINPDQANNDSNGFSAAYQFSAPGTVPFSQTWINFPQTLRFDSRGNIIVLEIYHQAVRAITLTTSMASQIPDGAVTRIGLTGWAGINSGSNAGGTWGWMDVDSNGASGPVDDILVAKAITAPAGQLWRISRDGRYNAMFAGDQSGAAEEGSVAAGAGLVNDPSSGAYAWVVCFDQSQNRILTGGFRHWGLECWRGKIASDPVYNVNTDQGVNTLLYEYGHSLYWHGTVKVFPWGYRPSLASLHGPAGQSFLGRTIARNFDAIAAAYPTDGDFTRAAQMPGTLGYFINTGMDGSVPRPEITGNDLRALCYYIRRSAQSGSYPKPAIPGPSNTDASAPIISGVTVTRQSPTSINVAYTTNKPTIGMVIGCSDQVYANRNNAQSSYCCWSSLESGFGTSHNQTITTLPAPSAGHPTHISVLVKDIAGSSVYYPDQVVS
jgi:hypothetical protein